MLLFKNAGYTQHHSAKNYHQPMSSYYTNQLRTDSESTATRQHEAAAIRLLHWLAKQTTKQAHKAMVIWIG